MIDFFTGHCSLGYNRTVMPRILLVDYLMAKKNYQNQYNLQEERMSAYQIL